MKSKSLHRNDILNIAERRVAKSLTGIPIKYKRDFIKDVSRWMENNGQAYTVSRLKDIKQVLLHSVNSYRTMHSISKFNQEGVSSYIKMRTSGRVMHGYLGELQLLCNRSDRIFEQVLQLIHIYTLVIDEGVSQKDIDGLRDIIEPRPEPNAQEYIDTFCMNVNGAKLLRCVNSTLKQYAREETQYILENNKCVKHTHNVSEDKSYLLFQPIPLPKPYSLLRKYQLHENKYYFSEIVGFLKSNLCYDISKIYPELIEALPQCSVLPEGNNPYYPVGYMLLINEGGQKKRWVENTKHVIQSIVDPLATRLYDIVKYLPWDVTFHESSAFPLIQKRLKQGLWCYSVDISKATDKIPMDYNVAILKKLLQRCNNASKYIDVFNLISKANVMLPEASDVDYANNIGNTTSKAYDITISNIMTRWGTGQPMGSRPSFAMLTLVHSLILIILNGYKWDESFIVHGDDVVILDDELYRKYISFLDCSGIPRAVHKSIAGNAFAEINSKIVTYDNVLEPVKWKEISSRNVLEVAKYWGLELSAKLAKNNKFTYEQVKAILKLPYPLGAGLNPQGETLDERLLPFPNLIDFMVNQESSYNYIKSYRDLVLERYSTFATICSPDGNKEIDINFYHALLNDLSSADILDQRVSQQVCDSQEISEFLKLFISYNSTLSNRTVLAGDSPLILHKPMDLPELSKSKQRRKAVQSRLNTLGKQYQGSKTKLPLVKN